MLWQPTRSRAARPISAIPIGRIIPAATIASARREMLWRGAGASLLEERSGDSAERRDLEFSQRRSAYMPPRMKVEPPHVGSYGISPFNLNSAVER